MVKQAILGAFTLCCLMPCAWAKVELAQGAKAAYLNALMQTHQTPSPRQALLAEANMLLKHYALKDGQQISHARAGNKLYQLSIEAPGQLTVRTEEKAAGSYQLSSKRYQVFGLNPYVGYECDTSAIACQLRYPGDDSIWLAITKDRAGAKDLAQVMSYLLRDLQKG